MGNDTSNNKSNDEILKKLKMKQNITILIVWGILFFMLTLFGFGGGLNKPEKGTYANPEKVTYTTYETALKEGKVDTVYVDAELLQIRYTLINDDTKELTLEDRNKVPDTAKSWYYLDYPGDEETFRRQVVASDTQIQLRSWAFPINASTLLVLLNIALPVVFIIFMWKMFSQNGMNKMFGLSSTAISDPEDKAEASFDDIIGHDEAIADIKQTLKIMQEAAKHKDLDVKPPRGILLIGPPGTGKTMIAKACAKEAGLNFKYVNSSKVIDRFVGQGANAIRNTFKEAKKVQPCILFFDEIDSIGTTRMGQYGGADSEYKQTLNALLQELDGFETSSQVFVMAATNMFDTLDPALIRPGRFDRTITITPPRNIETRKKLLEHYLKGCSFANDVNLDTIARQLSGMTGADIAQICNESKLIAIQHNESLIRQDYLEEAMDKAFFKGNRTKNTVEKDKEIVAYHESGHALSMLLNKLPIARISVIPSTSGVGGMVVNSDKDSMFATKSEYIAKIKSLYAGRIAEELIYGTDNITTGASNDIQVATQAIDEYINKFAFDNEESLLFIDKDRSVGGFNSGYDRNTYDKMNAIAKQLYEESKQEIEEHIEILKAMATKLLERETMDKEDVEALFNEEMLKHGKDIESKPFRIKKEKVEVTDNKTSINTESQVVEESSKEASVDSSYFKAIEDSYLHRLEEIEKKLREVEKENKRLKKEKNKSFIERILSKKR